MAGSIGIRNEGDFEHFRNFAKKISRGDIYSDLNRWGQMGVEALAKATPVRTGLAAESWAFQIHRDRRTTSIHWLNYDVEGGFEVVILLQYGHATGTGGYVQGRDFINPAMRPVFDRIAEELWEKVTNA